MKNKLLVTTALVGSLVASAAVAETKVSGNLEQTMSGVSYDGTNNGQGTTGFGAETNIALSGSKDLDNGLSSKYGFTLEDGSSDTYYLTVGTEAIGVTLANDYGLNTSGTTLPFVSDTFETVVRDNVAGNTTKITYTNHGANAHDKAHISIGGKVEGVQYVARYAPSAQNRASDSDISGASNKDSGGSVTEFVVKGDFNGVGFLAGIEKAEKDFNGAAAAKAEDIKFQTLGLSYNFGQFAVGVTQKEYEDGTANREDKSIQYGASVALNDNFTAGVYYLENDRNSEGTDEEITMAQVGYNMGGLGLELSYAEAENAGFSAGTDYEIWQIRTKQNF